MIPSISAFILSFFIILITWVNRHNALKLVRKSSSSFIYANGFLLLTVVFMPFPTALVGDYIWKGPCSACGNSVQCVSAFQSIGWILMTRAALSNHLVNDEK
jgi:uncharacterized membrane protein